MHHASVHPAKSFLVDIAAGDNRAARHVAAAQTLRERDDIRLEVPMLESKHFSGPPEAGLDFITNEEGPVFAAEGLGPLEKIAFRRLATFALDRFDHERRDVAFRKLTLEPFNIVERDTGLESLHERPEPFGKTIAAHERQRAEAEPVKSAFEGKH